MIIENRLMSQIQTKANTLHTKNVANAKGRCPFQGAGINVWEVRLITTTLIVYLEYFIKIIKKKKWVTSITFKSIRYF